MPSFSKGERRGRIRKQEKEGTTEERFTRCRRPPKRKKRDIEKEENKQPIEKLLISGFLYLMDSTSFLF